MQRLDSPDCYFRSISVELQKKRDYICSMLKNAGMEPVIPEAGYFVMANWSTLGTLIDILIPFISGADKQSYKFVLFNKFIFFSFKKDKSLADAEKILQKWKSEELDRT